MSRRRQPSNRTPIAGHGLDRTAPGADQSRSFVTVVSYEEQLDGFVTKVSNGNSIFRGSYVVYSYDDGRVVTEWVPLIRMRPSRHPRRRWRSRCRCWARVRGRPDGESGA